MMRVFIFLTSYTLEINQNLLRLRKIFMFIIYGTHTGCIMIIITYNYYFLFLKDREIKTGLLGAFYQFSKFVVLIADLLMIANFYKMFNFFI